MSYLAIARKYRPATFEGIVGQEHVTRTLRNAILRDRIHHAFLFCGARGVGKTTAARALAKALNCVQGPTPEPCGTCISCTEIGAGTSPDLIEIDGASNNSVDDVRDLRETVRYAPTHGRRKIYLVDEVHMLSNAAFNALLKTLEEPPPHVVFIFATTEPHKIPDTILSRVQRFDFKRIPVAAVVAHLDGIARAEGVTLSETSLRLIARAGEGSMRDAQSLLDKVISFSDETISDREVAETLGLIDRGLLYRMLGGLVEGDVASCLETIDEVHGYGFELSQFTGEMLEVLRNATFLRMSQGVRRYVDLPRDELEQLDTLCADVDPEVLARTFSAFLDTHDQVARAERPRIVLEMAVARLATTRPLQPVGALVGRLEQLERRLRQGGQPAPTGPMHRGRAPRRPSAGSTSGSDDGRSRPGTGDTAPSPPAAPAPVKVVPPPAKVPETPAAKAPAPKVPETAPAKVPVAKVPDTAPSKVPAAKVPETAPSKVPQLEEPPAWDEPPPWEERQSGGEPSLPWEDAPSEPVQSARAAEPRRPEPKRPEPKRPALVLTEPEPDGPRERWARIAAALSAVSTSGGARLAAGEARVLESEVIIALPPGRAFIEARRALTDPEVLAVVREHLGIEGRLTLEERVAPPPEEGVKERLRREVLDDPRCKHLADALGAALVDVEPLEPGETP